MNEHDAMDSAASSGDVPQGLDPVAGIVGVLFVVLGAVFLLDALEVWDARAAIVLPVLVIGLGVALLASVLRGSGRAR